MAMSKGQNVAKPHFFLGSSGVTAFWTSVTFKQCQLNHDKQENFDFFPPPPQISLPCAGGGLLLLEQTLADDKVSVVAAAVWDVIMMAHGGVLRSPAEFRVWLRDVGFEDVRVVRTQEHNECDVIYAKKPERADRKKSKK